MNHEESDFIDDIVVDSLPVHIQPSLEFKPWHKVRKEYIRRKQWNLLTVRMVKRYWDTEITKPVSCLVIPGEDILDIRALWEDTSSVGCHIRYLGFNEHQGSEQEGTQVHIANNSVTSLHRVSTDSQVLADRFESIVKSNSQARRYLKQYGPYHVVNLDFCGSLFPNNTLKGQNYRDALHQLLNYQFKKATMNWLLFVTTEVDPINVDEEEMQKWCKAAHENVKQHPDFAHKISALIPSDIFQGEEGVNIVDLDAEQIVKLFGVSFGKWLLHLCQESQPKWSIAMRPSFRYSINEEKDVIMLALAFEVTRQDKSPTDSTGVSKLDVQSKTYPTESELATKIVDSVAAIKDVDEELAANPTLKENLRESQANLLHSAGYNRDAYIEWVQEGEN